MVDESLVDEQIESLLPWYINNTLSAEERERVDNALEHSEHLRDELAFLRGLAASVTSESVPEVSELGWRRLQKQMHTDALVESQKGLVAETKYGWFKPFIASAAVLLIALQVQLTLDKGGEESSRLLSAPSIVLAEPHWRFQLEIANEATWGEIFQVINSIHAVIIDGPSSLGIISIAVPQKSSPYKRIEELEAWLEKQAVISYAAHQDN